MKLLLPQTNYRKACLHTHSTVSDGKLTPEEVRDAYRAEGYGILALTDHSAMIAHNDLTEPDFLMLTGVEIDFPVENSQKTCHLCLLSRDPELQWIPFRDPQVKPHMEAWMDRCQCEGMDNRHTPEAINAVIAKANGLGCLVTYNHPVWSMEHYPDYSPLEGLWGMEYRNSGCAAEGYDENNEWVFREFTSLGKFPMPVMADDMHRVQCPKNGCPVLGRSWVMVGAEKLEYGCVMDALARGDLYSSCGPELYGLTWDNGILRVNCSPAAGVRLMTNRRPFRAVYGEALTGAEFDLTGWLEKSRENANAWIQVMVTAADGTYAVTRAYRIGELL